MVNKISFYNRLSNLEKRNNGLKSLLLHDQLKHDNYSYKHLENKILLILNEYQINKSLTMSAFNNGINPDLALKWFVEGQKGNPKFEIFYQGIKRINSFGFDGKDLESMGEAHEIESDGKDLEVNIPDYEIESFGDSWIYRTYLDGNRISVISSDLKHLKEKVSNRNLPIN